MTLAGEASQPSPFGMNSHHWTTVTVLCGDVAPAPIDDKIASQGDAARRKFLEAALGVENGAVSLVNALGETVYIDHRLIDKTLSDETYRKRTPYVAWAPACVVKAVEVWRI